MTEGLFNDLGATFDLIFNLGNEKDRHDYKAGFLEEKVLLTKKNKGFCLTGTKNLSMELSYRNAIIFGGSGTGKSSVVLVNTILSMDCSMIIHDPSAELYKLTAGRKKQENFRILVLNYAKPEYSISYNPIERAHSVSEIGKVAHTLIKASMGDGGSDKFWSLQAENLLIMLISLVKKLDREYQNLANVRRLLQTLSGNPKKMDKLVIKYGDARIMESYRSFLSMADRTFSSVTATALAALNLWQDDEVARTTAKDDLDFTSFRKEKVILYIQNSTIDLSYYSGLTSVLTEQLFGSVMEKIPDKKDNDVAFLLDELSSLTLPSLPITMANIRKYRGAILNVLQDYKQLVNNYGRNNAESIRSNCFAELYFTGSSLETAKELETLLGKYTYEDENERKNTRLLMSADEIRTIPMERGLIICSGHRPIYAVLTPFYKNRKIMKLTSISPPELKEVEFEDDLPLIPLG